MPAGGILAAYMSYLLNGIWEKGISVNTFMERFNTAMRHPFGNYYKEYGTSTFADIKVVNKVLAEKEESKNRILSQNVRMRMDTRKTKLNLNTLAIGGSGAGKTYFFVKPNLMQLNRCSYIITDPKGGAKRSYLKRVGTALY